MTSRWICWIGIKGCSQTTSARTGRRGATKFDVLCPRGDVSLIKFDICRSGKLTMHTRGKKAFLAFLHESYCQKFKTFFFTHSQSLRCGETKLSR